MSAAALVERESVGDTLAVELASRGWSQADFAEIIGRPVQFVSEIIAGKKELTRESAAQFAVAFDSTPQFWLNLQDSYLLWLQERDQAVSNKLDDVRLRKRLRELAPIALLVRRGTIPAAPLQAQVKAVEQLYDIDSIWDEPQLVLAAKRSNLDEPLSSTQQAWVALAQRAAEIKQTGPYSRAALDRLARELPRVARTPGAFAELPDLFAESGVALVYVEALPSSKIDGCSFIVGTSGQPAIALSGRGKRLDKVLFALLHEVAHILLGHLDDRPIILDEHHDGPPTLGVEADADSAAVAWVLPTALPPIPMRIRVGWVDQVATSYKVHPIVLVGQLQKRGVLDWRTALVRGAPNVDDQLQRWNG
ncbi:transcriptional regulator [Curtobacterium sp. Curtsp57]|uniref:transcriptional regulator n=1 Tax=Curtobacterium sp. Curtsp57 TaxID=3243047 RepID=UPI0039B5DEF6